jgi:hypothetical protein
VDAEHVAEVPRGPVLEAGVRSAGGSCSRLARGRLGWAGVKFDLWTTELRVGGTASLFAHAFDREVSDDG